MRLVFTLLILYSPISYGTLYYGYYGNCNNPISMFDFKNQKYEAYIESFKYTRNGKQKTYKLIKGKLRKIDNVKYIVETTEHEPITLYLDPKEEYLWGENKMNGKHWYKPCNFESIPELIKNVKKNSS